jgi:hypothetical protein
MHSWLKEFYPIPAADLKNASDTECLKHSILKFTGLLKKELIKHKVFLYEGTVSTHENPFPFRFKIDGKSCALCQKYYYTKPSCKACPLYTLLGHACDRPKKREEHSIYYKATHLKRPYDMLNALEECLKHEKERQ